MNLDPYRSTLDAHEAWLSNIDAQRAQHWRTLLANNPEAAAAEALVWETLDNQVDEIWPGADPPDFGCRSDGSEFHVECTAIMIDTATTKTTLTPHPASGGTYKRLLPAVENKIREKSARLANCSVPAVLAVATFHFQAGAVTLDRMHVEDMLHGPRKINIGRYVPERGEFVNGGGQSANLCESVFFKEDRATSEAIPARRNISAVVLLGLGGRPRVARGMIHPEAVRRFKPEWLPNVAFCRFARWPQDEKVEIAWVKGNPLGECDRDEV